MEIVSINADCMTDLHTVRDIVDLWPTRGTLADDMRRVAPHAPVTAERISKWPSAGSIPPRFQQAVIDAAAHRGFNLTAEQMVSLHAAKPDGRAPEDAA